ncbi:MAG: hypothetical protein ACLFSB_12495, partial [Chitinispirillaceae bacterium]
RGGPEWGALAAALLSERPITTNKQALRNSAPEGVQNDFLAMAALIGEAHRRDFDPGACSAIGVNGSAARQVLQTQQFFNELVYVHPNISIAEPSEGPEKILGRAILLAYPDRLARRRDQGTFVCEMRDDRRGELAQESTVRKAPFLVAADVRETRKGPAARSQAILSYACEVREDWLKELFADRWQTDTVPVWNNQTLRVEAREQTRCMGVLIEERKKELADEQKVAAGRVLAENILSRSLKLAGWAAAQSLIGRIRKAAERNPEVKFPAFDEKLRREIVYRLCEGHSSYREVKEKAIVPIVEEMLSGEAKRRVDENK